MGPFQKPSQVGRLPNSYRTQSRVVQPETYNNRRAERIIEYEIRSPGPLFSLSTGPDLQLPTTLSIPNITRTPDKPCVLVDSAKRVPRDSWT